MFSDIFGITKIIKDRIDNLSISIDEGLKGDDHNPISAVFLYTPNMDNKKEHYHIELNFEEVIALKNWCDDYLKVGTYLHKKYEDDLKRNSERNRKLRKGE